MVQAVVRLIRHSEKDYSESMMHMPNISLTNGVLGPDPQILRGVRHCRLAQLVIQNEEAFVLLWTLLNSSFEAPASN